MFFVPVALVGGTPSCPRMCCRSSGMSYLAARWRTSLAVDRYISGVYHLAPSAATPSCSMPMEWVLRYQLPACQATSLFFTICVTWPSDERTT